MLLSILVKPKNALIKQYRKLFKLENLDLSFDDAVYEFIVDKAMDYKLGARGLRSICESIMMDAMFEVPSATEKEALFITMEYAQAKFDKSEFKRLKVA